MQNIYLQYFTRDLPLYAAQYWFRAERNGLERLTAGGMYFSPLFLFDPEIGTQVFYSLTNPKEIDTPLTDFFQRNPQHFDDMIRTYSEICDWLSRVTTDDQVAAKEVYQQLERLWPLLVAVVVMSRTDLPKIADICVQARERTDKIVYMAEGVLREKLLKIYPALGDDLDVLTDGELFTGPLPNFDEIGDRKRGYICIEGKVYSEPREYEALESRHILLAQPYAISTKTIRGVTAQAGNVTGTVSIVRTREQAEKLRSGQIMVSPMTTPDFMSAIRHAAALVTDEGGITCHAAIVARELQKPCIIGTKVATKILKDGDEVEVDAKAGIVKILKRA